MEEGFIRAEREDVLCQLYAFLFVHARPLPVLSPMIWHCFLYFHRDATSRLRIYFVISNYRHSVIRDSQFVYAAFQFFVVFDHDTHVTAVPAIIIMADSTVSAFKSGIFCLAISSISLSLMVLILSLFDCLNPFPCQGASSVMRYEAGGCFKINVKLRSSNKVISIGMSSSMRDLVLSLNCVQNCWMLIPACPSTGPSGGAGFA